MSTTADRKSARPDPSTAALSAVAGAPAWYRTTLAQALAGSLLMWASLPPVGCWLLAWIAPVPWLLLARQKKLSGRRPYAAIWLAGFLFWLGVLHWLRLPHWATSFGWVALSFYLAFYVPLFVGLTRVAVQRLGLSLIVAAPVVWMGLELARAHLMGGFTMGSLEHSQYRWLAVIQIADLFGEYGVCAVIILVAACVARILPVGSRHWTVWPLAPLIATLAAVLLYGRTRLAESVAPADGPTVRVALIQGSIDTEVKSDPGMAQRVYNDYMKLSLDALNKARQEPTRKIDLIVWPETMFLASLFSWDENAQSTSDVSVDQLRRYRAESLALITGTARDLGDTPLLLGIDRGHLSADGRMEHFNSAIFVSADGDVRAQYDKMHPVPFGEYVPLADRFPWLNALTPTHSGLTPGAEPIAEKIAGLRFSPDVCYETAVPHLIRRQINELAERGQEPDVLVNLTNDGWFWGSSELDLHLMCGVFRAVECRKPLLIAANPGFSAAIDGDGRIFQQGGRRTEGVILADVRADGRSSFHLRHGDWLAGVCLACCGGLAAIGIWDRRRSG